MSEGNSPGSWWMAKAPRMKPGAVQRKLVPTSQPFSGPPGNMAVGGPGSPTRQARWGAPPAGPAERNPTQPADPYGWASGRDSRYREGRIYTPPAVLRDVDIGTNFFSPFQPVMPFAPLTGNYAREWDYPVGVNIDYQPRRLALMQQLRLMSQSWGLLRTVIETRKDQLLAVPWDIMGREGRDGGKRAGEIREFFRKPDRKNRFSRWARLLLEDLFVIDAPCLYVWRRENNEPYAIEVVDGATIFPLVDDAGRRPDWPSAAFQQIIKGLPAINLTERELIYAPMRPRPELPVYGYSPVEQIYLETTEGIRRTLYQLDFWTEGTLPELMITVPDGWSPQQIAMFQASFDALMNGSAALKSRVRFVPGGMKPFDIKNANGEALKSDYDEWLARLVCYAFSVNPQPFVKEMNRATAEVADAAAKEEGTQALQAWFKGEIMDPLIQEVFGAEELEFVWQVKPEADPLAQAELAQIHVRNGIRSINEVRAEIGLAPAPEGGVLRVYTAAGATALAAGLEGEASGSK
ncbi:MAG TPA: phage portal protein [Acetobacteraceae bacterium]|nr:phage portal protein [Acetobacteraceae bacterium]